MERKKPIIFISHIHEDNQIAVSLSKFITDKFLGFFNIFVSGDGASIRAGDNWSAKIEGALKKSDLIIALITEESLERKWIYFETGGAFFMGKRVIPVLCNNLKKEKLGNPLAWLQAIEGWNQNEAKQLFNEIAKTFEIICPQFDSIEAGNIFNSPLPLKASNVTIEVNKPRNISLPIFVLVDTSGSMIGEKLYLLNTAIRTLLDNLNQRTDVNVLFTLIQYDSIANVIFEATPVSQINSIPDLKAGGTTSLGAGFNLLTEIFLKSNTFPSVTFRPYIFILTDGLPSDDWKHELELFRKSSKKAHESKMYTLCFEDSLKEFYKEFSETIRIDLTNPNSINNITSVFQWLSNSMVIIGATKEDVTNIDLPPFPYFAEDSSKNGM
jgi:uncharacterized protein YegL